MPLPKTPHLFNAVKELRKWNIDIKIVNLPEMRLRLWLATILLKLAARVGKMNCRIERTVRDAEMD